MSVPDRYFTESFTETEMNQLGIPSDCVNECLKHTRILYFNEWTDRMNDVLEQMSELFYYYPFDDHCGRNTFIDPNTPRDYYCMVGYNRPNEWGYNPDNTYNYRSYAYFEAHDFMNMPCYKFIYNPIHRGYPHVEAKISPNYYRQRLPHEYIA